MPIDVFELVQAAQRSSELKRAKGQLTTRGVRETTAFLSHSSRDKTLAEGLQVILLEQGWNVYLYWKDNELSGKPTDRATADRIQQQIKTADFFLFLATSASIESRWCPWEIGYADSVKSAKNLLIVCTQIQRDWFGSEYLQLYRQISQTIEGGFAVFEPGETTSNTSISDLNP